jgi:hypothetical protein
MLFYSNILNSFISLFNYIPTTDLLIYWSIVHYYNRPLLRLISQHSLVDMRSRLTRDTSQEKPRL